MLSGGTASEVFLDHQDAGPFEALVVECVVALGFLAVVFEGELAESVEGDAHQVASGDDAIGVDVVTAQDTGAP